VNVHVHARVETGSIYRRRCANPAVPWFVEALRIVARRHRSRPELPSLSKRAKRARIQVR